MGFTEECEIFTDKNVLIKNVDNWAKYGPSTTGRSQKDKSGNGNTLTLWERYVPSVAVSKEGHADNLQRHKRICHK